MPDDIATAVAEPPAETDAATKPADQGASGGPAKDAGADTAPATLDDYVIDPDTAQRIPLKAGEKDFLAQEGYRALMRKNAAERKAAETPEEPGPELEKKVEPAFEADDEVDDAAAKRVARLEADLKRTQDSIAKFEAKDEQRALADQRQKQVEDERKMLDELARQNSLDSVDPIDREMVEARANRIASDALANGQARTFADCYGQAKTEIGDRLAAGGRTWLEGKKKAADTAAEPPGGTSAAELPTTAMPVTKEDSRRLAQEVEDGTVTERAHQRFKRMMANATD